MKPMRSAYSFIALSAMITVSACSSSSTPTSSDVPKSSSSVSVSGPLEKYSTPIEVSTVRVVDATVKFANGDTIENNVWAKAFQDELGIKVKYNWIATTNDDATQKLNVMIASGDLPDFFGVTPIQLKQLVDAGMVEDLSDLYSKYATPLTKKFLEGEGPEQLNSAKFNGKLMAIPSGGSSIDGAPLLWVRTDWLKKLNLTEPKTMQDVYKIAEAFTKQDPDGNGKNDTFGLGVNKGIGASGIMGLSGYFAGFQAFMGNWVKDASGNLVYGSVQPEMKPALLKLQEMYKAGFIDKEFGVKDGNKTGEDAVAGRIGLYYGSMWNPISPLQKGKDLDPKMEWTAFPIVGVDSKPARPPVVNPTSSYYVIKKGAKNPEALLKMINLYAEKGWGEKQDYSKYVASSDGIELFKYAAFRIVNPNKNMENHLAVVASTKSGNTTKFNAEQQITIDKIKAFKNGNNKEWNQDRVFGESGSFAVLNQYQKQNLPLMNQFFGAATKTMGEKKATLDKMEIETFTKIITGAPIETFDKFVEDWKKLGGTDMTKEVNDWAKTTK